MSNVIYAEDRELEFMSGSCQQSLVLFDLPICSYAGDKPPAKKKIVTVRPTCSTVGKYEAACLNQPDLLICSSMGDQGHQVSRAPAMISMLKPVDMERETAPGLLEKKAFRLRGSQWQCDALL